jgi:phospholipid N-methyltransferase
MERHIGLAIYKNVDILNTTLGTASNKVYEYTASGLPFLYFDTPHFRKYLEVMSWAFPTDLSPESVTRSIQYIDQHYVSLSTSAREEFLVSRNYEKVFQPIVSIAMKKLTEDGV